MNLRYGLRIAALVFPLAILTLPAIAQQPPQPPSATQTDAVPANCELPSADLVQSWMELSQEAFNKVWSERVKQMSDWLPKLHPEMSADDRNRVTQILMSDKTREAALAEWVAVVQRHFCSDDVKQYVAFWDTPAGRKLHAETPAVLGETQQAWAAHLKAASQAQLDPAGSNRAQPTSTQPSSNSELGDCSYSDKHVRCLSVKEEVSQGLLVHKVQPAYPPLARQARVQGTVELKALIGKDGSIEHLDVMSGHPMLVPTAMDAVKEWKYKPFIYEGQPVEVETSIRVNFQLAEEK